MNYTQLINLINTSIQSGVPKNVTSQKLRQALLDIAQFSNETRGDYQGTATPSQNPDTPTTPVYFFATTSGTYTNFGGLVVDITEGINILSFVPGSGWSKTVVPIQINLPKQIEEWVRAEQFSVSGTAVISSGGVTLPQNIIYPDGTLGTLSNLSVTNGQITSVRFNYGVIQNPPYILLSIVYSGQFPQATYTPTNFN
jgi:hypothetical protein